ncbi:heterokaryon incompatibility protein-domain-containing protein [Xylariaceae sp. FL0016]|nr:heterokaryon incompatibility protein-domain-containing protein [Xylariaceae sp. FL0016]
MDEWNLAVVPRLYQPLGPTSLRLLLIHPGPPGSPLATELVPTTLDEADGSYDATSYTWGSPADPRRIRCHDVEMWVQANAFHMLQDLRRPDAPRRVWIDAVCIDQSSLEERAAQVSIMHHIYRRAGSVWVWLGRPDASSGVAMRYAAGLATGKYLREFSDCQYGNNQWRWAEKSYFFDMISRDDEADGLAPAIVDFLNRPWYSRIWVQQEAALCRRTKVQCGDDVLDWDNVFALAWIMEPRTTTTWPGALQERLESTLKKLQAVRLIQEVRHVLFHDMYGPSTWSSNSFQQLVFYAVQYDSTDPRDKIYAMQNLADDSENWFQVDYRIPWQILYANVAKRFLKGGGLNFLRHAGRTTHAPDTLLPSWAPDYNTKRNSTKTLTVNKLWAAGGSTRQASPHQTLESAGDIVPLPKRLRRYRSLPKDFAKFPDKTLLQSYAQFHCTMSDTIAYLGDVNPGPGLDVETMADIFRKDLEHLEGLPQSAYLNGESVSHAYRLTLILSMDRDAELVGADYIDKHWDAFLKWCYSKEDDMENIQDPVLLSSLEASAVTAHYRFAITKHGYFCLAPRTTQLGDEVKIFQGYDLAVVTRPWKPQSQPQGAGSEAKMSMGADDLDCSELIGDAYVHGMMWNEARCMNDEFNCKYNPTEAQWKKILQASDEGQGEAWRTLDLNGGYSRILPTLGPREVRLV